MLPVKSITVTTMVLSKVSVLLLFHPASVECFPIRAHATVSHLTPTGWHKACQEINLQKHINLQTLLRSLVHWRSLSHTFAQLAVYFSPVPNKNSDACIFSCCVWLMSRVSLHCGSVSSRYCFGGSVGPCPPAGQLPPGKLHLPGDAAQHRQDSFCI